MMQPQQQPMGTSSAAAKPASGIEALSQFRKTCHGRGSLPLKKRRLMMMATANMFENGTMDIGGTHPPEACAGVIDVGNCVAGSDDEQMAALALMAAASAAAPMAASVATDQVTSLCPAGSAFSVACLPSLTEAQLRQDEYQTAVVEDAKQRQHAAPPQSQPGPGQPDPSNQPHDSGKHGRVRIHHPPLTSPLPNGCHGRTSRNNSYCRRQPCYNGSKYCKLHYQQYVLAGGADPNGNGSSLSMGTDSSVSAASTGIDSSTAAVTVTNATSGAGGGLISQTSDGGRQNTTYPAVSGTVPHGGGGANHHHHHQDKRFTGLPDESQCQATTTRGRPCAYVNVKGTKYCHLHADYDTNPPPRRGGGGNSVHTKKSGAGVKAGGNGASSSKKRAAHECDHKVVSNDLQSCRVESESPANVIGPLHAEGMLSRPSAIQSSADTPVDSVLPAHLAPRETTVDPLNAGPDNATDASLSSLTPNGHKAKSPDKPLRPALPTPEATSISSNVQCTELCPSDSLECFSALAIKETTVDQEELPDQSSNKQNYPLLSSISSDQWSNKLVLISTGPLVNHTGRVSKWGNGWVTVCTSTGSGAGEGLHHNRRAVELFVIPDDSELESVTNAGERLTATKHSSIKSDQVVGGNEKDVSGESKKCASSVTEEHDALKKKDGNSSACTNSSDEPSLLSDSGSRNTRSLAGKTNGTVSKEQSAIESRSTPVHVVDGIATEEESAIEPPCTGPMIPSCDKAKKENSANRVLHEATLRQAEVSLPEPGVASDAEPTTPSSTTSTKAQTLQNSDERSLPLVESLSRAIEGRGGRRHNLDLLFGTAALERSRRTIHKPERYEDKAMIEKKKNRHHQGHSSESESEGHVHHPCSPRSKRKRSDPCHKVGKKLQAHDRHDVGHCPSPRAKPSANRGHADGASHHHASPPGKIKV